MVARLILGFILCVSIVNTNIAQSLDEEIGFLYVKAEYLFETNRYDEAIVQYNKIVASNVNYKDALVHRGEAKYALAAYKGAKLDALLSIENRGISAEASALLGRSFVAMDNEGAGINCLTAAISLDPEVAKYYEWRAKTYEDQKQLIKACSDYEKAMNLGSQQAEFKAKSLCGVHKMDKNESNNNTIPINEENTDEKPVQIVKAQPAYQENTEKPVDEISDDEVLSSGESETQETTNAEQSAKVENGTNGINNDESQTHLPDDSEPAVDDNLPKDDNFIHTLDIDDDLSIEISGQELGKRDIKETPSILILADENGTVSLNICVNKAGIVTKAEFNASLSTIAKKSLVSLALRKAKEFEFATGKYDTQCGIMVFKIKAS